MQTSSKYLCLGKFSYVRRQGNYVAYNIIRYASGLSVWMENILPYLSTVLLADLAELS